MIALLRGYEYFYEDNMDIRSFLIVYMEHLGNDTKIFKTLANSDDFTIEELVEYVNSQCWDWEQEIVEIYTIGEKVY